MLENCQAPDDSGAGADGLPRQPTYKVRTSFSCLDRSDIRGGGAQPAPVGTEAAARAAHASADVGDYGPAMGYYEVVLPPPPKETTAQRKRQPQKTEVARFSYTDWSLNNLAAARPGTTLDIGAVIKWIGEAEPRTPDDALPLLHLCKDALKNVVGAELNLQNSREADLEKQVKELLRQRDEARARADELHAQCEHLQLMVQRFEVQTTQMQERLDAIASQSTEQGLQSLLDAELLKNKHLEVEITSLRSSVGKLADQITISEQKVTEIRRQSILELNVPITEKVKEMTEDELLQHIVFVFTQPVPWGRLGPELLSASTGMCPPPHMTCMYPPEYTTDTVSQHRAGAAAKFLQASHPAPEIVC